jgi:Flp pilus assembly protein TadD
LKAQAKELYKQSLSEVKSNNLNNALNILLRAMKINPKFSDSYLLYADIQQQAGKLVEAAKVLKEALKYNKKDLKLYHKLFAIQFALKDPIGAEQTISKALKAHPNDTQTLLLAARISNFFHKIDQTGEYLLKASKLNPKDLKIHEMLGSHYERNSHIEKLKDLIKYIRENISTDAILKCEGKLFFRDGKISEARKIYEHVVEESRKNKETNAEPYFMLAQIYHKEERYDEAFDLYTEGNNIKEESGKHTVEIDLVNSLLKVNSEYYATKPSLTTLKNPTSQPPLFLVGFPRSGNTLHEQIIYSTDKYIASDEKEYIARSHMFQDVLERTCIYPDSLEKLTQEDMQKIRDKYFNMMKKDFGELDEGKKFLDKMPSNTVNIAFIHKIFPDAKIIMCIRDPRDVILSNYFQNFDYNSMTKHFYQLENAVSFYEKVMDLYLCYKENYEFPIYESKYEELVDDFENKSKSLMEFIGEEWTEKVLQFHKKKRNSFTPNYIAINQPIYKTSSQKWRNYEEYLEPYMARLEKYAKAFGYE